MTTPPREVTERFNDRVEDYLQGRPRYPRALLSVIQGGLSLPARPKVADIGAGTGFLTELFAEAGWEVVGVEPSLPMAEAAQAGLSKYSGVEVKLGKADETGLDSESVDLIVAGQAFHWFDPEAIYPEWARILRPTRGVALVWNRRLVRGTPFLEAYEAFLHTWGVDYAEVSETYESPDAMARVFGDVPEPEIVLNHQPLDVTGLNARIASSSYMPGRGHPRHEAMMDQAQTLFRAHQTDGKVELIYQTSAYIGTLA